MAKYQADKLQRWALSPLTFRYMIEHVPGEVNVWSDLLSRWGAGQERIEDRAFARVARLAVVQRVSPLEEPEFAWPTEAEIRTLQRAARGAGDDLQCAVWSDKRSLMVMPSGQVWIPPDTGDLQQRLCVKAHAGRDERIREVDRLHSSDAKR
ncbi:hypothetical protein PInf_019080 [Phytophthora infestans]|nr:hypothetical protein PInf_019080 [Phytophthora infestans]